MGQFLIIIPGSGNAAGRGLFRHGLNVVAELKLQTPNGTLETDFSLVASFPRLNGSGTPVTADPKTGNWVATIGTWFHKDGYGAGREDLLLDRFTRVGADQLAGELEGFFAIALGDAAQREVTVITDIIGTCHCFSRDLNGMVAISGSSLVLAALSDSTLDPVGCQEFLATSAICEDRTFYREVRKLEAVTCYVYKDGKLQRARRYWHARDLPPDSLDGDRAVQALSESVVSAARRITSLFPRTVVDLTGGYDSRAAVSAFMSAGVPIVTTVAGSESNPDVITAARLARVAGLPHRHLNPDYAGTMNELQTAIRLTDGEFNIVEYSRIFEVHRMLSADFDISVNGYAGEHGRGYGWEFLFPHAGRTEKIDSRKLALRRLVPRSFDSSIIHPRLRLDFTAHFTDVIERTNRELVDLPNTAQYDYCLLMLRASRWQGRIASATNQLWPCLAFFLMRSVLDVMLRTNTRTRRRSYLIRKLIAELQPRLAEQPLEQGYPAEPVSLRNFYRFLPVLTMYGKRAKDKIDRRLGRNKPKPADTHASPRARLWSDPAMQDLLRGGSLLSAEIMDQRGLENFIDRSSRQEFAFDDQWARLLSLEFALQRLHSVKSSFKRVV